MEDTTLHRDAENLAILIMSLIVTAEERAALDSHGSAANFRDQVKYTLRHILQGQDPCALECERSEEINAIIASVPHKEWMDMLHDDAYHGSRTQAAKDYDLMYREAGER